MATSEEASEGDILRVQRPKEKRWKRGRALIVQPTRGSRFTHCSSSSGPVVDHGARILPAYMYVELILESGTRIPLGRIYRLGAARENPPLSIGRRAITKNKQYLRCEHERLVSLPSLFCRPRRMYNNGLARFIWSTDVVHSIDACKVQGKLGLWHRVRGTLPCTS